MYDVLVLVIVNANAKSVQSPICVWRNINALKNVHVSFTLTDWKIIWVNAVNQGGNDLDFAFHIIKNGILVMQDLPLDLPVS